jgi:putative ABC transport system ATP-binding protein
MNIFFNYLKERNAGMILVTHDESLASQCNYIYRMHDGILTKVQ